MTSRSGDCIPPIPPDREEGAPVREATRRGHCVPRFLTAARFYTLAMIVAIAAAASGCGSSSGPSPSQVASAANAQSCDNSTYFIQSKLDKTKQTIYDCTFPDGKTKCVTYSGGIANDSTALVRVLFANTLGANKPSCLG